MDNLLILIPQLLNNNGLEKSPEKLNSSDFAVGVKSWALSRNVVYQKGEDLILLKSDVLPVPYWICQQDLKELSNGKTPINAYLKLVGETVPVLDEVLNELKEVGLDLEATFKGIRNEHLSMDKDYQTSFGAVKMHYQIRDGILFLHRTVYDNKKKLKMTLLLAYMEKNSLPFDSIEETLANAYLDLLEEKRTISVAS